MTDPAKLYSVNLHYEDPEDPDSDGCATGHDFATLEEARAEVVALLNGTSTVFRMPYYNDVPWIEIDGPDVNEVTRRPKLIAKLQREREEDDRAARREQAMEAGMGLGIHAYNEVMGYDSEEYDPSIHGPASY